MSSSSEPNMLILNEDDLFVIFRFPNESHFQVMCESDNPKDPFAFHIHPFSKSESDKKVSISSASLLKNIPFQFTTSSFSNRKSTEKEVYIRAANYLIDKMNSSELQKVVLSRVKHIQNPNIDYYELFQNLSIKYPKAFIFFYNIPGQGAWMGATPEVLLEEQEGKVLTEALAATQQINGRSREEVTWNEKEIEEQAIIQRFIESNLHSLNIEFDKSATQTAQAGNVYHLKTSYTFNKQKDISKLINKLHPGPAICGMPKENAMDEITKCESHNRDFYCGYLGLKGPKETRYFINLRSMQIYQDAFALFVGGGLTADSEASSEWEETEIKSNTLQNVIQTTNSYAEDLK